jgi:S1-C subfamily serine protease
VQIADGLTYSGRLAAVSPESDLALIRIKPEAMLPTATLCSSEDLVIGETVIRGQALDDVPVSQDKAVGSDYKT